MSAGAISQERTSSDAKRSFANSKTTARAGTSLSVFRASTPSPTHLVVAYLSSKPSIPPKPPSVRFSYNGEQEKKGDTLGQGTARSHEFLFSDDGLVLVVCPLLSTHIERIHPAILLSSGRFLRHQVGLCLCYPRL